MERATFDLWGWQANVAAIFRQITLSDRAEVKKSPDLKNNTQEMSCWQDKEDKLRQK